MEPTTPLLLKPRGQTSVLRPLLPLLVLISAAAASPLFLSRPTTTTQQGQHEQRPHPPETSCVEHRISEDSEQAGYEPEVHDRHPSGDPLGNAAKTRFDRAGTLQAIEDLGCGCDHQGSPEHGRAGTQQGLVEGGSLPPPQALIGVLGNFTEDRLGYAASRSAAEEHRVMPTGLAEEIRGDLHKVLAATEHAHLQRPVARVDDAPVALAQDAPYLLYRGVGAPEVVGLVLAGVLVGAAGEITWRHE